ncbi:MAG: MHS family MFS transporter [Euzebyales bacterium]|nr:MHS family MFS transporter [Euzebyales bacterium]
MAQAAATVGGEHYDYSLKKVIFASSAGTMIEWYDFYIFGTLAAIISKLFFPPGNETVALLSTLAVFATGFVVRPFGAAFFGRIGDIVGRKFTFLMTISIMGGATFIIGLLPTYNQIGLIAPFILVILRLLQGLALGGEYGGAAIYVAEHAPDDRRGYFTAYIQTTATLGLLLSLGVIIATERIVGEAAFASWGWRIPFLLSGVLVLMALYIRLSLKETPLFQKLKASGKSSTKPLSDAFRNNAWKLMVLALFGATAGQGVVWYTGQFYALFFLQTVLEVSLETSALIVGAALILATPFFLVFGRLSDRIGRKRIILTGCLLGAVTYVPLYAAMNAVSDPLNAPVMVLLIFIQVIYVTMVYGPIAAFLVELFPAKVRYTSLSLPYHIGNGVFGGLVPLVSSAIVAATGNIYAGLSYPIVIALMTFFVGIFLLRETNTVRIYEEVGIAPEEARAIVPT